jgi:hypothetical protein
MMQVESVLMDSNPEKKDQNNGKRFMPFATEANLILACPALHGA